MYAKLVNGTLRRAPNKVNYKNKWIYNPSTETLLELGYLPVIYRDMPADAPDSAHYESSWMQSETEITQAWNLVDAPELPEPELSAEEALNIIMGCHK